MKARVRQVLRDSAAGVPGDLTIWSDMSQNILDSDKAQRAKIRKLKLAVVAKDAHILDLEERLEVVGRVAATVACRHPDTHREGAIWEVCDDCGAEWSDDRHPRSKFPHTEVADMVEAALDLKNKNWQEKTRK